MKQSYEKYMILFLAAVLCAAAFFAFPAYAAVYAAPAKVTGVKVKAGSLYHQSKYARLIVRWKKAGRAGKYRVFYRPAGKKRFSGRSYTKKTSYTISGLAPGKTYYIKVRAYRGRKAGRYSRTLKIRTKKHIQSPMMAGISLDCSNRYYSVDEIEQYIRLAGTGKHGYVQLHLTGDENIGIECDVLDHSAGSGNGRFLTNGEIRQILKYAKKKKVEIVPEIDMPGHTKAFAKLYRTKYGNRAADEIFDRKNDDELRIGDPEAVSFAEKIYGEYSELFSGCRYFHIGCDEFWSGNSEKNVSYINRIASFMKKRGFHVFIWNDLITKKNMDKLDRSVTIAYWSLDGDTEDKNEKAERRKTRASFTSLQKAGFSLLNYNSYYLYYVPKKTDTKADDDYMVKDLKENWDPLAWDGESGRRSSSRSHVAGAAIAVWNEDSKGVSSSPIYRNTERLYGALLSKLL